MIDTAMNVIGKGAVEHAKDVAQDALDELKQRSERLQKPDIAPKRRVPWMLLLFGAIGIAAIVVVMVRRRAQQSAEPAPDPFGTAVEEERAAGMLGQRPVATPGA